METDELRSLIRDELKQQSQLSSHEQKNIAYYSALINAWVTTRFEFDRSLLTLSAGGIGLVVTLLTTFGVTSMTVLVIQAATVIAFAVSGALVFYVYKRNAQHLIDVVKDTAIADPVLKNVDRAAVFFFALGIILLFVVGVYSAYSKLQREEINVPKTSDPKSPSTQRPQGGVDSGKLQQNSIEGIGTFKPQLPQDPKPVSQPAPVPAAPDKNPGTKGKP